MFTVKPRPFDAWVGRALGCPHKLPPLPSEAPLAGKYPRGRRTYPPVRCHNPISHRRLQSACAHQSQSHHLAPCDVHERKPPDTSGLVGVGFESSIRSVLRARASEGASFCFFRAAWTVKESAGPPLLLELQKKRKRRRRSWTEGAGKSPKVKLPGSHAEEQDGGGLQRPADPHQPIRESARRLFPPGKRVETGKKCRRSCSSGLSFPRRREWERLVEGREVDMFVRIHSKVYKMPLNTLSIYIKELKTHFSL